jgi:hypothetical protein
MAGQSTPSVMTVLEPCEAMCGMPRTAYAALDVQSHFLLPCAHVAVHLGRHSPGRGHTQSLVVLAASSQGLHYWIWHPNFAILAAAV